MSSKPFRVGHLLPNKYIHDKNCVIPTSIESLSKEEKELIDDDMKHMIDLCDESPSPDPVDQTESKQPVQSKQGSNKKHSKNEILPPVPALERDEKNKQKKSQSLYGKSDNKRILPSSLICKKAPRNQLQPAPVTAIKCSKKTMKKINESITYVLSQKARANANTLQKNPKISNQPNIKNKTAIDMMSKSKTSKSKTSSETFNNERDIPPKVTIDDEENLNEHRPLQRKRRLNKLDKGQYMHFLYEKTKKF